MFTHKYSINGWELQFFCFNPCYKNLDVAVLSKASLSFVNELNPLLDIAGEQYVGARGDWLYKKGGEVILLLTKYIPYHLIYQKLVKGSYEILICDVRKNSCLPFVVLYRAPTCKATNVAKLAKAISDFCVCSATCMFWAISLCLD